MAHLLLSNFVKQDLLLLLSELFQEVRVHIHLVAIVVNAANDVIVSNEFSILSLIEV